ncbi:MAG: RHS repeat-associated core domain-containing protein [Planctomycetota bacterium]
MLESITRDGRTWTLNYNSLGQVVRAENGAGRVITYTYNAQGQRVGRGDSAETSKNYLVGVPAQNLGVDIGQRFLEADTSGGLLNGWVYAGENPILRYDAEGNVSYYLEDASDSIAALTDGSGNLTATYRYDAFGNLLAGSDAIQDLGYHAAWHDPITGLIDMRARSYDPETGRFLSVDPVAPDPSEVESYNPYIFANNNPHLYSDPTGGFSLAELNVTQLIQSTQQTFNQLGIQYSHRKLVRAIREVAIDTLVDRMANFLPFPDFTKFATKKTNHREGDFEFHKGLDGLIAENTFCRECVV